MRDVGVGGRERFRHSRRGPAEQQDRSINGVGERPSEHELAPSHGALSVREVCGAQRQSPFGVLGDHIVEEEIMHGFTIPLMR